MKPDWKDAPEWAKWLSYNTTDWFWSENKPVWNYDKWELEFDGAWGFVRYDPGYTEARP